MDGACMPKWTMTISLAGRWSSGGCSQVGEERERGKHN